MADLSMATPRPWRVEAYRYSKRGQVYTRPAAVISGDGKHWIANSVMGHNLDGSSEANAALIVAAVNAYDKARELAELTCDVDFGISSGAPCQKIRDKAREVLRIMGGDNGEDK